MVTSACFSPTLNRVIGLGLLERGFERKGEIVTVFDDGRTFDVRITDPVFYDPDRGENECLNIPVLISGKSMVDRWSGYAFVRRVRTRLQARHYSFQDKMYCNSRDEDPVACWLGPDQWLLTSDTRTGQ